MSADSPLLRPGDAFGSLRIESVLGSGCYGRVYLARDEVVHRLVALKVIATPTGSGRERDERHLLREARAVGSVRHRNVVTLHRVHSPEVLPAWVYEMEYVEGGTLEEALSREGRYSPERALDLAQGMAEGLRAAHDAGVVHGDLKPSNILLDADGTPKLADFGLARILGESDSRGSSGGGARGTPTYMAPEVVTGERASVASDVWSFGVVLYRVLTGRHPFPDHNAAALFYAILKKPFDPFPPGLTGPLTALLSLCLEKDSHLRPESGAELVALLEEDAVVRPMKSRRARVRETGDVSGEVPVGRKAEAAMLADALLTEEDDAGSVLLLTGEVGIGKATLARYARHLAVREGMLFVEARLTKLEGLLRPLLAAVRVLVTERKTESPSEVFDTATRLAATLLDEEATLRLERRTGSIWTLEQLLRGLASEDRLVVLLEDAHLADAEDRQVLNHFARHLPRHEIVLLLTAQADLPEDEAIRTLVSVTSAREIRLEPLERDDLYVVLSRRAQPARIDAAVADRILTLAAGNPMFALQLFEHLQETRAVETVGDEFRPGPIWDTVTLPERFHDLVAQRIADLPEDDRAILDIAAIDGTNIDAGAVAALLDRTLLDVLRRLQSIHRSRGLVEPSPGGFRFTRALWPELIAEEMAPAFREELHRALGEHLAARPPTDRIDPERLGHHWESARRHDLATPCLLKAAEASTARQEATRVLDLCRRAGLTAEEPEGRLLLLEPNATIGLAMSLADVGRREDADRVFRLLAEAAEASGDETLALRSGVFRDRVITPFQGVGEIDAERNRRATEILPPSRALAGAHYNLGALALYQGRLEEAERSFLAADEVYREIGFEGGHSSALDKLGTVARRSGDLERAQNLFQDAARASRRVGRRMNAAVSEVNAALAGLRRGALSGLEEVLGRAIRTLELEASLERAGHATIVLAHLAYARGDLETALGHIRDARRTLEERDFKPALVWAYLAEGEWEGLRGRLDLFRAQADAATKLAEECGDRETRYTCAAKQAQLSAYAGNTDASVEAARRAIGHFRQGTGAAPGDLVSHLCEAAFFGLPAEVLDEMDVDVSGLPAVPSAMLRGVRALRDGEPAELRAAAEVLLGPGVGERRGTLRLLGRWLLAAAAFAEGDVDGAQAQGRRVVSDARDFGHIFVEDRLLERLVEWSDDDALAERRRQIRQLVRD